MSLSLAERERRAKERTALQQKKKAAPKSGGPVAEESGSLFDKYAGLAGRDTSEEDEVAELMEMLGTSPGSQRMSARQLTGQEEMYREAGWDPSPHRNPPAALKYIKPQTREPWAIDAAVYNSAPGAVDTSDFGQPTRYGLDMNPPLSVWRIDDQSKRVAAKPGRTKPAPEWNSKPFRSTPYALRGIKPAPSSTDPWVKDHKNRKANPAGDFENTDVISGDGISKFDNGGGEAAFKNFDAGAWDNTTVTPYRTDGRHGRVRGIN